MGSRPGIFVPQHFNFGPLGPRDWSLDEMRRLFSWLKDLGYDTLDFPLLTVIREPSGEFNVYEQASLYHSVSVSTSARPATTPEEWLLQPEKSGK